MAEENSNEPVEENQHRAAENPYPLLPLLKDARLTRVIGAIVIAFVIVLFLFEIRGVSVPVLLALALSYILVPIVDRFERRGIPRPVGAILLLVILIIILLLLIGIIVPQIVDEFSTFFSEVPNYGARLRAMLEKLFPELSNIKTEDIIPRIEREIATHGPALLQQMSTRAWSALEGGARVLSRILTGIFVPVFLFFFLKDWHIVRQKLKSLLPLPVQQPVVDKLDQIDETLSSWLRGVLTIAIILACLYGTALAVLGVPMGLFIGVISGLAYPVPFLSPAIGLSLSITFSLLESGSAGQIVGILLIYGIGNAFEGLFLTPKIVGNSLGMSAMSVILAVLVAGELFGFLGVLLALPVAAVVKVIGRDFVVLWRQSDVYQTGLGKRHRQTSDIYRGQLPKS